MSKSIFISCVHEDSHWINNIKKWAVNRQLGENIVITQETDDMRPQGYDAIKRNIRDKILGAACIFVLIGKDTQNHKWIHYEVELANSFKKDVICIRIPETTGAVPEILSKKLIISFNPNAVKKLLLEMLIIDK